EPVGPQLVRRAIRVLTAIDFDNEMFLEADKIDDVFANQSLSLEFRAFEAMRAQEIPEPALGIGHVATERFRLSVCHPLSRPRFARAPSPKRGEGIILAWQQLCQLLRGARDALAPLALLCRDRLIDRRRRAVRRLVVVVDLREPLARFLGLALPVPHAGIEPA